jgi:hypothetical protein
MSLTTIRAFRIGQQRYRHAMCLNTDAVFLQRYQDNEDATCDDDLWVTLLKYDSSAVAYDADGRRVGSFRTEGGADQWVFYERPNQTRITFEPTRGAEALLDTEVQYSKHWLERQRLNEAIVGAEVMLAAANTLQLQIDQLTAQQEAMLKPHAMEMNGLMAGCQSAEEMGRISVYLDTWPRGFYRSELRTAWNVRKNSTGVRWPKDAAAEPANG